MKNMKFEEPQMQVIRFAEEDILTAGVDWRETAELEEFED